MIDRRRDLELSVTEPAGNGLPETKGQFAIVPLALLSDVRFRGLPKASVVVLLYLLAHRNKVTGLAWPSMRTLARDLGLHLGTICSAVRQLGDSGLIAISLQVIGDPPRLANVYDFDRSHFAERSPVRRNPNGDRRPFAFPSVDRSHSHAATVRIPPNKIEEQTDKEKRLPPFEQPGEDDAVTSSDRQMHAGDFSEFWRAIPVRHRQSPVACREEFIRARRRGADPQVLITRIAEYYGSHQGRGEFANHPRSWLEQGKYDDPSESWKSSDNKAAKARNEKLAHDQPSRRASIGEATL